MVVYENVFKHHKFKQRLPLTALDARFTFKIFKSFGSNTTFYTGCFKEKAAPR